MNESRTEDVKSLLKETKKVKGLSKDVMQQLSQLPTPVLHQ